MVNGLIKARKLLDKYMEEYGEVISRAVLRKKIGLEIGIDERTYNRYFKVMRQYGLIEVTVGEENIKIVNNAKQKLPKRG